MWKATGGGYAGLGAHTYSFSADEIKSRLCHVVRPWLKEKVVLSAQNPGFDPHHSQKQKTKNQFRKFLYTMDFSYTT